MSADAAESGVTIKAHKGYDASWLTPKGSPEEIKLWLMEFFGLTEDAVAGATPHEVMAMAEDIFQGRANVASQLGGTVVSKATEPTAKVEDAWSDTGSRASEQAEADPNAWLIEEISKAKDNDALKRLWAANKDAFSDEKVKDAYKAKHAEFNPA